MRQKTPSQSPSGQHTTQSPAAESQTQQTTPEGATLTDEYSLFQWIGSVAVTFVTFPVGLVVPAYLYYKAQNGTGKQQSGLETWTAILFGILAVEIGGRTAAKLLWGLFVVVIGRFSRHTRGLILPQFTRGLDSRSKMHHSSGPARSRTLRYRGR